MSRAKPVKIVMPVAKPSFSSWIERGFFVMTNWFSGYSERVRVLNIDGFWIEILKETGKKHSLYTWQAKPVPRVVYLRKEQKI